MKQEEFANNPDPHGNIIEFTTSNFRTIKERTSTHTHKLLNMSLKFARPFFAIHRFLPIGRFDRSS